MKMEIGLNLMKFPSNHNGTYKKHGEWALPVYPSNNH